MAKTRSPIAVTLAAALTVLLVVPMAAPGGEGGPGAGPGAEAPKVQVNFEDMPLRNLIHQVEHITGKSFTFKEDEIQRVKVSLSSDKQVSPDEFLRIFETLLQMNSMTLVPVVGSGNSAGSVPEIMAGSDGA